MLHWADLKRRSFLLRSWLPAAMLWRPFPAGAQGEFRLHPKYREDAPLDAALLETNSGQDDFVIEVYHDRIAAIMADWSGSLLQAPANISACGKVLAGDFLGSKFARTGSTIVRPGPPLHVEQISFARETPLGPEPFQRELRAMLSGYTTIHVAEFQVTRIEGQFPGRLQTRVRYELVGAGGGFHREQRIGFWELEWEGGTTGDCRLRRWQAGAETRSRSKEPCYADVTAGAFGAAASYQAQMLHGADHWRGVLDGACGIDIYGHNGVSVGDIDNDGFDDVYVCQPGGLPNRLYRNRGDGTFEDITEASGTGLLENTACALFADFDNDGRQDLVVVRASGPLLFLNQGGGRFRLKQDAFRFANTPQGTFTGAAAADYNRDGWLDLYFCLYVYYQGAGQYKYPVPYYDAENGPPNFLMRNNGDGTFRDVTAEAGLNRNNTRYSFGCGWSDYNGDGWPDLYVVNDFGRKNLYRNNGDGTFTDVAAGAGVEDTGAGMSVCWQDFDNDGAADLYVADMWTAAGERITRQTNFQKQASPAVRALYRKHAMGNSFFHNGGKGVFEDATARAEVGMGRWAWSSDAWDFDHDGYADLYVANGMVSGEKRADLNSYFWRRVVANSPDEAKASEDYEQAWNVINELIRSDHTWSGYERNVFYANNGDGTFADVSGAVGLDFIEDSRAFALADFDHDGRQEVLLKNRGGPQLRLLENVIRDLPPSIAFRLRGVKSNRDAIGAAVMIQTGAGRQTRMLQAGSGFLSQHSKEIFFGLGEAKGPVQATIRWPSGLVQEFRNLPPDHRIFVEEGIERVKMEPFQARALRPAVQASEDRRRDGVVDTWLLSPVPAPRVPALGDFGKGPVLLNFTAGGQVSEAPAGVRTIRVDVSRPEWNDAAAVYNLLYRYLFDRHRDLQLPASFLIDGGGDVVKVYQGPLNQAQVEQDFQSISRSVEERLRRALPFPGAGGTYEFGRNHLSLGAVFFQRGYAEQAEPYFRLALRDDPASAEAQYGLGSVYLKQEKIREAQESFEKAIKLQAGYPETHANAWNNLGLLATREARSDQAIRCFQEALRLRPEHFIALENLGNAYRQAKNWKDARETLEQAVALKPRDPEANYSLGMVFAQLEETRRAYEHLQKALEYRPAYPEALNNLGVLYLRTGKRDEAVAKFQECIRAAPAFDQAYLNLARVYGLEGEPEKARAVLRELLQQRPGHEPAGKMLEQLR